MRRIEAEWLGNKLAAYPVEEISPILEIGSSSLEFRTVLKGHIEEFIHAPLRARGVRIVTADLRNEEGVEIVGDVYDPQIQKEMAAVGARTLMLCNLFEHLTDPQSFADTCRQFLTDGGRLIVTVPRDFPYHLDPIDTMFRPNPQEIQAMFPGTEIEIAEVLVDGGYWEDLRATRTQMAAIARIGSDIVRAITLRGGYERARSRFAKLTYLFRPYKISAVIMVAQKVPS